MAGFTFPNSTTGSASLGVPQGVAPASPVDGDIWYDSTQKTEKYSLNGAIYVLGGAVNVISTAPAAISSSTGVQTFATIALPTGFMNVAGKVIRVKMQGIYSSGGAQTPTVGIQLGFSGAFTQTECVATSQAVTASQSNFPWEFEGHIYTVTTGATGTLEAHGRLAILLGNSATAPESVYQDTNTGANGAVNLTAVGTNNLLLQVNLSNTLASIQLRTGVVEALN
jgi:hypothetical protein